MLGTKAHWCTGFCDMTPCQSVLDMCCGEKALGQLKTCWRDNVAPEELEEVPGE